MTDLFEFYGGYQRLHWPDPELIARIQASHLEPDAPAEVVPLRSGPLQDVDRDGDDRKDDENGDQHADTVHEELP